MAVRGTRAVRRLPGPLVGAAAESVPDVIGPITLDAKRTGKPGAGEPHAGFDVAGAGDVTMGAGLRPTAKAMEEPPDPTVRAPVLDPTGGGRQKRGLTATTLTTHPMCVAFVSRNRPLGGTRHSVHLPGATGTTTPKVGSPIRRGGSSGNRVGDFVALTGGCPLFLQGGRPFRQLRKLVTMRRWANSDGSRTSLGSRASCRWPKCGASSVIPTRW